MFSKPKIVQKIAFDTQRFFLRSLAMFPFKQVLNHEKSP